MSISVKNRVELYSEVMASHIKYRLRIFIAILDGDRSESLITTTLLLPRETVHPRL